MSDTVLGTNDSEVQGIIKFYNIQWVMRGKTSVTEFEFTSRVLFFYFKLASNSYRPLGHLLATMPREHPAGLKLCSKILAAPHSRTKGRVTSHQAAGSSCPIPCPK